MTCAWHTENQSSYQYLLAEQSKPTITSYVEPAMCEEPCIGKLKGISLAKIVLASDACGYPDSPTRLLREVPQAPFGTQIFNLWLRVHLRPKSRLRRLASETLSAESVRTLLTATGSPLAVVFFFLLWFGLLHRQDPIHIVLDRQQLPHGGAGLPVLAVSRFLVCQ